MVTARVSLTTLAVIDAGTTGRHLLAQISRLSQQHGHNLIIHELEPTGTPMIEPMLSAHQMRQHPEAALYREFREIAGHRYALKKRFTANEGSSAIISWSPRVSQIQLNAAGDVIGHGASEEDKVSTLAHELVHAKHMMAGTWKGSYGDHCDASCDAGKEELRAVGLAKYRFSRSGEPSENSVRSEHGLPKRKSYDASGYRTDSD